MNIAPAATALVLVDLQNDFLHPDGAYGRANQSCPAIAALPARLTEVADAMRSAGGWIVSTHFTLVPGKGGAPFISPHLKALRPFLGTGDFAPGSTGQALIDELQPADLSVEKVAFSAFYQSRLEWMLGRAGIASTVRDAHVRDFHTVVLSDGCAAFSDAAHNDTIGSLSTISEIATCAEIIAAL